MKGSNASNTSKGYQIAPTDAFVSPEKIKDEDLKSYHEMTPEKANATGKEQKNKTGAGNKSQPSKNLKGQYNTNSGS